MRWLVRWWRVWRVWRHGAAKHPPPPPVADLLARQRQVEVRLRIIDAALQVRAGRIDEPD